MTSRESSVQSPVSRVQSQEAGVQSQETRSRDAEPGVQDTESKAQSQHLTAARRMKCRESIDSKIWRLGRSRGNS